MWRQKTLGKSVTMKGTGLHTGVEAVMTLEPAPVNTGLVFVVPGPDGEVEIPARVEYAVARDQMNRATSLEKDGA
ncbi:UDP-3-O-[3-hydroxymyristoyl] N-acetylglucosamine deacetylase, partial [bacterium CG17_big_fil_post_rev_8_21_14_2_50_64_8]